MDTHQIRKLSPDGIVSTLTGSQEAGYRDGSLQEARFNQVIDCSVDQEGNLLVVDDGNHRIRHISPNGFVSTLIGNGLPAVQDGNREQASLGYSLSDIQPLPDGILFVADGKYLREFKNGELKTLNKNEQLFQYQTDYLDGPVEKATFGDSLKLTADNEGNLFIADFRVKKLRVMSKDKIVSTLSQDVHQVGEKYGEDFINYWIPQPIDVVFDPFRHKLYVSTTKTIYESQLTGEAKIIADPYLASKEGKNFPFDSVGGGLAFGQDRQLYFTDYKAKRIGRVLLPSP